MENPLGELMFGAIVIAVGFFFRNKAKEMAKDGVQADATVVGNQEADDLSYPIVEFTDQNNEKVRTTLNSGYRPAKNIGTTINIVYDPNDISNIMINSHFMFKTLPVILFVAGGLFVAYNIYDLLI